MTSNPLPFHQRHFSKFALGGLGSLALLVSFAEHDRRGLLMFELPEAFAVESIPGQEFVGMLPMTFPVSYIPGQQQRGAARAIPPRGSAGGALVDTGPTAVAGGGAGIGPLQVEPGPDEPTQQAAALPTTSPAATRGTGSLGDIPNASFGNSPISAIVLDNPDVPGDGGGDPVVPAVPEPASWLLMLLGIGALGGAMRRYRTIPTPRLA